MISRSIRASPRITVSTLYSSHHSNITARSMSSHTSRTVAKAVYAHEVNEGVGARVRRSIGGMSLRNLSPFLMLDHATVLPGAGFPDHPHRGQTTVSYILGGKLQHEDFLGNKGILEQGDVQWMTAGKGIVHSEMPYFDPDPAKAEPSTALQLWIDLPQAQKFIEPSYQEKKAAEIDTVRPKEGVEVTVISGESHGTTGFVRPVGGCWFFDFKLQKPGVSVFQPIPQGWTAFVYIISGQLAVGGNAVDVKTYDQFNTLVLSAQDAENGVLLTRPEEDDAETRFILVAGEPLDQPVVQYGPFVVNTQMQAREAILDFQLGRNGFEKAPGWKSVAGQTLTGRR